jgi:hypothetical protein
MPANKLQEPTLDRCIQGVSKSWKKMPGWRVGLRTILVTGTAITMITVIAADTVTVMDMGMDTETSYATQSPTLCHYPTIPTWDRQEGTANLHIQWSLWMML